MKDVAGQSPDNDDRNRAHERPGSSEDGGGFSSGNAESVLDKAEDVLLLRLFARFPLGGFRSDGNYWIALAARVARFPPNLFFRREARSAKGGSRIYFLSAEGTAFWETKNTAEAVS